MIANITHEAIVAYNKIKELGLSAEIVQGTIDAMVAAKNSCTENDVPGAGGWKAWADGTRRLRELCSPLGWIRCDDRQISCVYDPIGRRKFVVMNADAGTGSEGQFPQNRNKKGATVDHVIEQNCYLSETFMAAALNSADVAEPTNPITFWYLCVYIEGETVRAELSCPRRCDGGYFTEFSDRIIIQGVTATPSVARSVTSEPESEFEVTVIRKSV